jgi:hypothetical protein
LIACSADLSPKLCPSPGSSSRAKRLNMLPASAPVSAAAVVVVMSVDVAAVAPSLFLLIG